MLELDHIVVACADLDSGEAWLRERLGVPLAPGGIHAGWGTHNRLLQLGGGTYLDAALAALRYDPGTVSAMSRGALRWRITLPPGGRPAADGLLPTVIAWDIPPDQHPAARLPDAGVRLAGFEVRAPATVLACRPEVRAAVPIDWVESDTPGLAMTLDTPAGRTTIGCALG